MQGSWPLFVLAPSSCLLQNSMMKNFVICSQSWRARIQINCKDPFILFLLLLCLLHVMLLTHELNQWLVVALHFLVALLIYQGKLLETIIFTHSFFLHHRDLLQRKILHLRSVLCGWCWPCRRFCFLLRYFRCIPARRPLLSWSTRARIITSKVDGTVTATWLSKWSDFWILPFGLILHDLPTMQERKVVFHDTRKITCCTSGLIGVGQSARILANDISMEGWELPHFSLDSVPTVL